MKASTYKDELGLSEVGDLGKTHQDGVPFAERLRTYLKQSVSASGIAGGPDPDAENLRGDAGARDIDVWVQIEDRPLFPFVDEIAVEDEFANRPP